jgi:NADPH:quinone reductase-like Zn-dependent oxidoreductase
MRATRRAAPALLAGDVALACAAARGRVVQVLAGLLASDPVEAEVLARPTGMAEWLASDLAGVVEEVGAGVTGVDVGDEVIGYTNNRASHAEYVLVEAANLTSKPAEVPWEVAGALFVGA